MGILRMGIAALGIAGMVMVAERNTGEPVTPVAATAGATSQVLTLCQKQPDLCVTAAGAGLAALGAGSAAALQPPAPAAPPVMAAPAETAPAPRLTTASIAPTLARREDTRRLVRANVPLPPRRPVALR